MHTGHRLLIAVLVSLSIGALAQAQAPVTGFRGLRLGDSLEQVEVQLAQDPLFFYQGRPQVSFLPAKPIRLLEVAGVSYVERAHLQFLEDRLFSIILALDEEQVDYFSMYTTLQDKYGEPDRLSPNIAVWELPAVQLSLERPLSVKYVDAAALRQLREASGAQNALREVGLQRFLELF